MDKKKKPYATPTIKRLEITDEILELFAGKVEPTAVSRLKRRLMK